MNTLNLSREKTRNDYPPSLIKHAPPVLSVAPAPALVDQSPIDQTLVDQVVADQTPADQAPPKQVPQEQVEHSVPMPLYGEKAGLISQLKDCISSLFRKPPKVTALILALALSIPATIAILSSSFTSAEENLLDSRHLTVFLAPGNDNEVSQLAKTLAANKYITATELRPIDLQNKEVMALDVHPAMTLDKTQLSFIINELNSHTLVDYVAADLTWLERNVEAVEAARKLRLASMIAAGLFTSIIVFLLTCSDLPRQHSELRALTQMGASQKMLQKPLLLRSMLLALAAGITGTLLAWISIANLPNLVEMSTYEQILPRSFPAASMVSIVLLGIFCSIMTVRLLGKVR